MLTQFMLQLFNTTVIKAFSTHQYVTLCSSTMYACMHGSTLTNLIQSPGTNCSALLSDVVMILVYLKTLG